MMCLLRFTLVLRYRCISTILCTFIVSIRSFAKMANSGSTEEMSHNSEANQSVHSQFSFMSLNPLITVTEAMATGAKEVAEAAKDAARMRQLMFKEHQKDIQLRLREVSNNYSKSSRSWKNLRRLFLFTTNIVVIFSCLSAVFVGGSILFQAKWLSTKMCLCDYHCDHHWHKEFVTDSWNRVSSRWDENA